MAKQLRTFVLVHQDKTISPPLVTVRDYASWLEANYDQSICHMLLYLSSKKADGQTVLEWHPGTKIGNFFDNQIFRKPEYHSWYLPSNDKLMQQLIKHNFADLKECRNYHHGNSMLRVYTLEQIELYTQQTIDKDFTMANNYMDPKQMALSKADMAALGKPVIAKKRTLI